MKKIALIVALVAMLVVALAPATAFAAKKKKTAKSNVGVAQTAETACEGENDSSAFAPGIGNNATAAPGNVGNACVTQNQSQVNNNPAQVVGSGTATSGDGGENEGTQTAVPVQLQVPIQVAIPV